MGKRLADQASSGSMSYPNHFMGLSIERRTLTGLPDGSPSPYEGLTVEQARQAITTEQVELRQTVKRFPSLLEILSGKPELVDRYIDRFRMTGELEATKWWLSTTKGCDDQILDK
jgi:hypothetical protein